MPTHCAGIECDGCGTVIEDCDEQASIESVYDDAVKAGWKVPAKASHPFGYLCPKCAAGRKTESRTTVDGER